MLGVAEGKVTLRLGDDEGHLVRLDAGDMLVLPSGAGYRGLGGDDGLKVIGTQGRAMPRVALPRVALPRADPIYGIDIKTLITNASHDPSVM